MKRIVEHLSCRVCEMFTAVSNCSSDNELLNFAYTLPHDITTMPLIIRPMSISDIQKHWSLQNTRHLDQRGMSNHTL